MKLFCVGLLVASSALFAQQPVATPKLSTADQIAISSCESKKQQAQQQYEEANKAESEVVREWQATHPGFRLNPTNFTVEQISAQSVDKNQTKKEK